MAAQADRARPDPIPACEACEYSLAGIGREEGAGVCPECGEAFDAAKPWFAAAF